MSQKWDYDVPSEAIWRECLRVLKPGGYLLAFASTRTQHRMAVRVEDAGFEIRDMLSWVYGSGFPKSLDVSKAIDKLDAAEARLERRHRFAEWLRAEGVEQPFLRDLFHSQGIFSTRDSCSTQASSYLFHAKQGPAVPPRYVFEVIRPHIKGDVPTWVEEMVDQRTVESENFKRREVMGTRVGVDTRKQRIACAVSAQGLDRSTQREFDITAPATEAARQWAGWGTALKPAVEPITMARKPFRGTVAECVQEWGTSAMNIGACQVPGETVYHEKDGRYPANLIHDGSDEVLEHFPKTGNKSAGRFFYCAKPATAEREEGTEVLGGEEGKRKNIHPTVKPVDLMAYLCRLVCQPGGVILDPFMGSGSTGKAALAEGFSFIGIERDPEFFKIAQARCGVVPQEEENVVVHLGEERKTPDVLEAFR